MKDEEEKTFTVRGVKVKALFYIVLFAVVLAFSVAFIDFNPEGKSDLEKIATGIPLLLGILLFGLDVFWFKDKYVPWAFVASRVGEVAFW